MARSGSYSRKKGHNYERALAIIFRNLGFKYCRTSRAESKLLDDCGVDLTNLPFLVQAKAGYNKSRPKFEVMYKQIKKALADNFPPEHELHTLPILVCHKLDGRGPEFSQWTMTQKDMIKLMEKVYKPIEPIEVEWSDK